MDLLKVQGLQDISSTKNYRLGQLYVDEAFDYAGYRYGQAGATELALGKLNQVEAPDSNVVNVTVAATTVVGATSVTIDAGAAVAANEYEDGWLMINDATGQGQKARIKSNPVLAAAGELVLTLYKEHALKVALTVDVSEASLVKNPWKDLIVSPTTVTGRAAGVNSVTVTALYYAWFQVKGMANVLINGTPGVGSAVFASTTTAGALENVNTSGAAAVSHQLGVMRDVGVSTEYKPVFLTIE